MHCLHCTVRKANRGPKVFLGGWLISSREIISYSFTLRFNNSDKQLNDLYFSINLFFSSNIYGTWKIKKKNAKIVGFFLYPRSLGPFFKVAIWNRSRRFACIWFMRFILFQMSDESFPQIQIQKYNNFLNKCFKYWFSPYNPSSSLPPDPSPPFYWLLNGR